MEKYKVKRALRTALCAMAVAFLGLSACREDQDCTSQYTRDIKVAFFEIDVPSDPAAENDTVPLQVRFDSVYVKELPDTAYHKGDNLVTSLEIPVHEGYDKLTYVFVNKSVKYELEVGYKGESSFISEFCGLEFVFRDLEVLRTGFRFADVREPVLQVGTEMNIRVVDGRLDPEN
ncbi:hypothetical protein [Fulvitalea axinellae]